VNVLRAKRSKKIILGAVTAGVAAIGLAATLPAHAESAQAIYGHGATPDAALADALQQCADRGGQSQGVGGAESNGDGTYTVPLTCLVKDSEDDGSGWALR
jgi:hypothetical protein